MVRVVLDTNIVVSANLKPDGLEAAVFRLAANGKIAMCVSSAILDEYREVLFRRKFKFSPESVAAFLNLIVRISVMLTKVPTVTWSSDKDDNRFLECAQAANADFLITGNIRHFPSSWKSTRIVSAREFIDLMRLKGIL